MKVVHCHGTFDLLHPGHIDHLQQARALGDHLTVTITADRYVNKGPGRPVFSEADRRMALDALSCVDTVIVIPAPDAASAIRLVQPSIYCKGKDYEGSTDPEFLNDLNACREVGAEVRYVGDIVHSSTKLLNRHADHINPKVLEFSAGLRITPAEFKDAVESLAALKVGVLGDAIVDEYIYVEPQGIASKSRTLSVRRSGTTGLMRGGALAVLDHVKALGAKAEWLGLDRQSVKTRFIVPPSQKLFGVDGLLPPMTDRQELDVLGHLQNSDADVWLVADFGHGAMSDCIRDCVQHRPEAPFLALNCQTNSANHGFNIIDRQYQRADCFSLDETELTLSVGVREYDRGAALEALRGTMGAKQAWLTRGGTETIGSGPPDWCVCPPIATSVVDTVGAGDAFFAVAALGCAAGLPIGLTTFLGQLAGAQAVQIVGNKSPIDKQTLLKSGLALLNQ